MNLLKCNNNKENNTIKGMNIKANVHCVIGFVFFFKANALKEQKQRVNLIIKIILASPKKNTKYIMFLCF